jgi:hypothetical protein
MSTPVWNELQVKLVDHLSSVRLDVLAAQTVELPELVAAN